MKRRGSIEDALGIEELRAGFLQYTRAAYALLPLPERPRILDIGCGSGLPTIELAHLSRGEVVGIDTDESALIQFRRKIERTGLTHRVMAINASLYDTGIASGSFDVLWEEGVFHLLDAFKSLTACHRLLRPGGFLVMGETITWFEHVKDRLDANGFHFFEQYLLPRHCWWTDYYVPLETRIKALMEGVGNPIKRAWLAPYEHEIAMVKSDPDRYDCGFFLVQKSCIGTRPCPGEWCKSG